MLKLILFVNHKEMGACTINSDYMKQSDQMRKSLPIVDTNNSKIGNISLTCTVANRDTYTSRFSYPTNETRYVYPKTVHHDMSY